MTSCDASFERNTMVEEQLRARGIEDPRVLAVMAAISRELFVPERYRRAAHADMALPIGHRQTISQPLMVATMLQALELTDDDNVLEVGAGSGYQAALLGHLARRVTAIEYVPELAERARQALAQLGVDNVHVVTGDGSAGHPPAAPYDAIVVSAAAPEALAELLEQLAQGGRLVIPIGDRCGQQLTRIRRVPAGFEAERLGSCMFVPLVGAHGQSEDW